MAEDNARRPRGEMPDEELLSLVRNYEMSSLGSSVAAGATISTTVFPSNTAMTTLELDRYNALNMYFARPLGNEVEDRSQVVLPELRDTIEWIMPQLMRMFVGSKSVCRFEPENPQDEQQAELETMVVNHVFMQSNNGFFVLHDFFKDALLMRNGYVEVYTKEVQEVSEERYTGLTEIEVGEVLKDKDDEQIDVLEQREYKEDIATPVPQLPPGMQLPAPGAQQQQSLAVPQPVFDIKIRRTAKKKKTCVTCLPPEEMRVTPRAREGMEDLVFAMHITLKPRSDLITDGYPEDWVDSLSAGRPNWLEMDALARNQVVDQLALETNQSDRSMQEIELRKVIMRVDFDGDGVAELRRIVIGGDKIGENEVIEETPFASCAPKRMPHRHTGISIYDEIADLQVIKTTLWRNGLDNLAITNNQRVAVDYRNCNLDDLLSSRPGGVIRGNGPPQSWIMPFQQTSGMLESILPTLEHLDQMRADRTGIGRQMAGTDPDELQNVTKGGLLAMKDTAALKVELVARLLAEGVKDIFRKIHSELIRHQDKPLEFELSGKWVEVDPSSWRRRSKLTVNVGLGSGNREELRASIMALGQAQAQLAQMGLVGPKQGYETFKVMCEALGFQNPERFAMDPGGQEYQQHMQQMRSQGPPPNPAVQVAQIRAKSIQDKAQSDAQLEKMRTQADLLTAKAKLETAHVEHQQVLAHEATQQHKDREIDLDANHAALVQTIIRAIAPIIAAQLKGDPSADAGGILASDVRTADSGIEGNGNSSTPQPDISNDRLSNVLEALNGTLSNHSKARVATLPDGRQIRIDTANE